MGLLLTIILGGIAGWIASNIVNRDADMGILLNVVVGVVGALLANWILSPLFGVHAVLNQVTLSGFLMSVAGAVLLLIVVNLITRKSIR